MIETYRVMIPIPRNYQGSFESRVLPRVRASFATLGRAGTEPRLVDTTAREILDAAGNLEYTAPDDIMILTYEAELWG